MPGGWLSRWYSLQDTDEDMQNTGHWRSLRRGRCLSGRWCCARWHNLSGKYCRAENEAETRHIKYASHQRRPQQAGEMQSQTNEGVDEAVMGQDAVLSSQIHAMTDRMA